MGKRVSFIAFYAPARGRPTLFISKERWLLGDTPSAIVIPEMDESFQRDESSVRFNYVRAAGVIGRNRVQGMEPHIALHDASIELDTRPADLGIVERALVEEAEIGLTEREYRRVSGKTDED